jgi:hypothetical protein
MLKIVVITQRGSNALVLLLFLLFCVYWFQPVLHHLGIPQDIYRACTSGFGGLVVSMLASGSRVRGFKPGRSRRIFLMEKSSAYLPSEGKSNNLSHVPTLGHVKEPSSCSSLRAEGKIRMYSFLPSLIEASRAAWCGVLLEMKEGTIPIWGTKGLSTRPRCITLMTTHSQRLYN